MVSSNPTGGTNIMATLQINSHSLFDTSVIIRESDKYSQLAYLKFIRSYDSEDKTPCSDMFLTVTELHDLGKFLIAQATMIQNAQDSRHSEASI